MAIQFLIGGSDITDRVDLPSVSISTNITTTNDTAQFTLNQDASLPRPKGKQQFQIINGGVPEYGGVMANAEESVPEALPYMKYQCTAKDYSDWFNKRVITNTYTNRELSDIVIDIVNTVCNASGAGFTVNHVYPTGVYITIKFDHAEPTQAIQALADQVGFWFFIGPDKDVHFEPILTDISPLPNNLLDVDNDTDNYGDLVFSEDVSQVRNQVYLYGFKLPLLTPITEQFVGDGYTTMFTTGYELIHSLGNITVTVGGVARTNALDISGGLPPASGTTPVDDGKVYINYTGKTLRFLVAPAASVVVAVTYQPMIGTASMYNDPSLIALMKSRDGLDGIYEMGLNNPNLSSTTGELAGLEGQKQLLKFGPPHYTGEFVSYLQGWKTGQWFYLTSNIRMNGEFQNKVFYVLKVAKNIVNHPASGVPTFFYRVSIADNPYNF